MDSSNPYSHTSKFVDLLNCQQDSNLPEPFPYESASQLPVFSTQPTEPANTSAEPTETANTSFCGDSRSVRKERRKWPPSDDLVLISAWLNTSKDAIVSNEQKASTFWGRIAAYFAASPKVVGGDPPEPLQSTINLDEQPTKRPTGVKASKAASAKKPIADNEASLKFQTMCSMKEKDLALQERVSKMALLNSLISKTDPLSEIEQAVKTKLLKEMLDN
uniref:No apical meristem-associated C-terminal domain-containing protein n=1 Tax=Brassica oleracea var. oleracea TaxID=109376 RepID=A0A0D3AM81_BRAOL